MKLPTLPEMYKAVVALLGVVAQLIALGVVHGTALHWAQVILSAATAAGVFATPNVKPKPKPAGDTGAADAGLLLLVAVLIVVLILLFHGRIN